jgi:anthranilate/para-aminobenzoate synthase component I
VALDFQPQISRDEFLAAVHQAKAYIAAGDIYQVCLSHPFRAAFVGDAFPYYEALRRVSPAPFGAFLNLNGTQVASASPECFLRMSGRSILTRPIKGTRRRESDSVQDARAMSELLTSPKEAAELVMITDLERNDLGQVCEFGSVRVTELLKLEKFRQVHHLVSSVEGILRTDVTHPLALKACFPGGSISGAPKKRALEIIQELESWNRGIYTGAIGCFGFSGESRFSIAIRTAVFQDGTAEFGVGAGIVADSVPELEWLETLDKAAGLLAAAEL